MNSIVIINILSSIMFLAAIILTITKSVKRIIFIHSGIFIMIVLSVCLIVSISNVLEHMNIMIYIDQIEEYLEILMIPYFLLFIYSIASNNELNRRKEREMDLELSLNEREILLREVHHRIKNNLQTIMGLIKMQCMSINNNNAKQHLDETVSRINAMGLLYHTLYLSEDFTQIDLRDYLTTVIKQLKEMNIHENADIDFKIDVKEKYMNLDTSIPCGLIVNEVITNSLKYAFPEGGRGEIGIEVSMLSDGRYKLIIYDRGVGIPEHIDFNKNCGLGMQIIDLLIKQLKGELTLSRKNGTTYTFIFLPVVKEENRWRKSQY